MSADFFLRSLTSFAACAAVAVGSTALAGETVVFTTPTVFGEEGDILQPASIRAIDVETTQTETVQTPGSGVIGTALDADGNVLYGVVMSDAPLVVELRRQSPSGGAAEVVGTIFDSAGGNFFASGPGLDLAVDAEGNVLFTVPTLYDEPDGQTLPVLAAGGVRRVTTDGSIETVAEVAGAGAVGLAFDRDGVLYFGSVVETAPLIIDIVRVDADGATTTVGTALDTTGGFLLLNGTQFDLAVAPDGRPWFTTPQIFGDAAAPSTVSALDPETGTVDIITTEVGTSASGLAFDEFGTLFFGAVAQASPLVLDLRRLGEEGSSPVATIVDTTGGFISFTGQRLDLTTLPHAALAQIVSDNPCRADVEPIGGDGTVGFEDLLAVLSRWNTTSYIGDVDEDGVVDFSDVLEVLSAWGSCAP